MVDFQVFFFYQMVDQFVGVLLDIQMGLVGDIGIVLFIDVKFVYVIQQFMCVQFGCIGDVEQLFGFYMGGVDMVVELVVDGCCC